MSDTPFLTLLLVVSFIAYGVLSIMYATTLLYGGELTAVEQLTAYAQIVVGGGFILSAYGLRNNAKWGWILGTLLSVTGMAKSIIYNNYQELAIHATFFILLLAVSKHYISIPIPTRHFKPARPPTPPLPKPTTRHQLMTTTWFVQPQKTKRFVHKK